MMRAVLFELWKRLRPVEAHGELPPSHLRLAQVLATAWLFTGQTFVFPAPWLSPLEGVPELPWRLALALLSTTACVGLLLTRRTRTFAVALAAVIALESFAARTWVAHNRLFVLALLVTVALSSKRFALWPRLQVGLVYLLAAVDKLGDAAWRSGRFITSFLSQLGTVGLMWAPGRGAGGANPLAVWLSAHVGEGTAVALTVIAVELALAAAFFFGLRRAAWLNLAFHLGVFAVTGSCMGQFFFAGVASTMLLVREEEVPAALVAVLATALVAGPWTHHFLPLLVVPAVVLLRRRRWAPQSAAPERPA